MAQNMENTDFRIFFTKLHNNGHYWSKAVIFELFGIFLTRSLGYFVQSSFIFCENAQSFQK